MAKVKYYYDADTLSYREITVKKSYYYRKTIFGVLATFLIAFVGFIVFSQFIMSPSERAQKRELENEVKKQQEDELALLSKQSEDLNKDEPVQEVKWKYFVTVELHLYPGDHIPLSAYASLACSKKSNDIYNIWQNIITKI